MSAFLSYHRRGAFLLGFLMGAALPVTALAGQDLDAVLDLCAENVTDAPQTGAAFENLGWELIQPDRYEETAAALADADLANNAFASSAGPEFVRAREKWRTMRLNSLKATDGDYSWAEAYRAPGLGIVLVSSNAAPDPGKVTCMFVSPVENEIAALRSVILNGNTPDTNGVARIAVAGGRQTNAAGKQGTLKLHMMTLEGSVLEDALSDALLTSASLIVTFIPD